MTKVNLLNEIRSAVRTQGEERGVRFFGYGTEDIVISYEKLLHMSSWLGQKIPRGVYGRPWVVVIAASDPLPTLMAFFAALSANARPLILPGPKALGGMEQFLDRIAETVDRFPGYCVLALEENLIPDGVRLPDVSVVPLAPDVDGYGTDSSEAFELDAMSGDDDVAFLQMTSASTGNSKLVAVSHANACANLAALRTSLCAGSADRMATWLPLYHDMGLVGTTLFSFFHALPLYIMKPTEFIRRPHRWIDALSRYRCTITASPNFGYDYAANMVSDQELADCDLSSLRRAVIGAEPIRLATIRGFYDRFHPYGLRADSLVCSYGMAESTLGSTMMAPGDVPRYVVIDVAQTATGQPVRIRSEGYVGAGDDTTAAAAVAAGGVAIFSVGRALDGVSVELVDEESRRLTEEAVLGEIVLRGPSVSVGYFDCASAVPVPFHDGALHTGDLGFIHRGELFIMERKKHVIIRQGQNFLAALLEERIAQVLGRPSHEIMVFDSDIHDPDSEISVIVENFIGEVELSSDQLDSIKRLDLPIDAMLFSRKRIIPRTTSGKKKYDQARRRLAEGSLSISTTVRPKSV